MRNNGSGMCTGSQLNGKIGSKECYVYYGTERTGESDDDLFVGKTAR